MLYHVLICITVFMIICGRYKLQATNFLQGVKGFHSPGFNKESEAPPVRIKDIISNEEKILQRIDSNKNEKLSPEISAAFINKYFENNNNQQRQRRSFKTVEKNSLLDEDNDNGDVEKAVEAAIREDEDFQEEKMKVSNVTNSSKIRYKEIEKEKPAESQMGECDDANEENNKGKAEGLDQGRKLQSNDLLKMHFYKMLPEIESLKIIPEGKKSLVIDLYAAGSKSKREIQNRKKYDYIPAVRFTVVPSESRRRRTERLSPHHIPIHRYYP